MPDQVRHDGGSLFNRRVNIIKKTQSIRRGQFQLKHPLRKTPARKFSTVLFDPGNYVDGFETLLSGWLIDWHPDNLRIGAKCSLKNEFTFLALRFRLGLVYFKEQKAL